MRSKKCSNFKCIWTTRSEYGLSIAMSNFLLDRNLFKFHLQWYWTDFFEMTNIEIISKKCSNFFNCIWTTRSKYWSSIALSNFQLDRNLFKFHLQWYWTDFFEMTNIEIISKKCSNFNVFQQRSVNMGHLSHWVIFNLIATGLSSTLHWYWTDFFEMTNIEIISKKCSNFNVFEQRSVNMGHLSHWVIFNLIATGLVPPTMILDRLLWDDYYRDDFKEMFKF